MYLYVLVEGKLLYRQATQAGLDEAERYQGSPMWTKYAYCSRCTTHQLTFMSVDLILPLIGNLHVLAMWWWEPAWICKYHSQYRMVALFLSLLSVFRTFFSFTLRWTSSNSRHRAISPTSGPIVHIRVTKYSLRVDYVDTGLTNSASPSLPLRAMNLFMLSNAMQ